MGRWARVKCACPNRVPVNPSVPALFQCGHNNGTVVEGPGGILVVGEALSKVFAGEPGVFPALRSISDPQKYSDGLLLISGADVDRLRTESDALGRWDGWELDYDPERLLYLADVLRPRPEDMEWFWHRMRDALHQFNRLVAAQLADRGDNVWKVVDHLNTFCAAAKQTGNAIEFYL